MLACNIDCLTLIFYKFQPSPAFFYAHRVEVPCSSNLNTYDLETEIFLHIFHNCLDYVQDASTDPDPSEAAAAACISEGDGMGG